MLLIVYCCSINNQTQGNQNDILRGVLRHTRFWSVCACAALAATLTLGIAMNFSSSLVWRTETFTIVWALAYFARCAGIFAKIQLSKLNTRNSKQKSHKSLLRTRLSKARTTTRAGELVSGGNFRETTLLNEVSPEFNDPRMRGESL
jgi:hypothetical protein